MKRYKQFQPIVLSDFEADEWHHPVHNHNHYELIFIKHGSGKHYVNQIGVDYQPGDVFLLGPEDAHYFEISSKTRFIYLKFTGAYVNQEGTDNLSVRRLEYLIKSRETHLSGFKLQDHDKRNVSLIFDLIIALRQDVLLNTQLIWMQLLTLSAILQRNMPDFKPATGEQHSMQSFFCYIHKHIYEPARLRAEIMAAEFNMTATYIGPFFKRHAGVTLREYIHNYRYHLIKQRMESGHYSLKQIAADFGLTDESHVSKLLQKVTAS